MLCRTGDRSERRTIASGQLRVFEIAVSDGIGTFDCAMIGEQFRLPSIHRSLQFCRDLREALIAWPLL